MSPPSLHHCITCGCVFITLALFQYRRLTGGRRKRGRDPSLNDLIEIKGDDVKDEIEMYRKHNSEEAIDSLYKPVSSCQPVLQIHAKLYPPTA